MSDSQLLDLLLEHTPQVIALTLRDGVVLRCSQGAQDLLNAHAGRPIGSAFDERSSKKLAHALETAPSTAELQAHIDGELIPVRIAALPLGDSQFLVLLDRVGLEYAEGMARQVLAANDHLTNVTRDLACHAAELDAARRRFEALASLRDHFISMLAHDVRGALSAVTLTTDSLERACERGAVDQTKRHVDRIRRNVLRVTDVVDKVLEAARTESGRVVIDTKPLAMRSIVRDAYETYRPIAESRGVELAVVDTTQPDGVEGDRVRLGQVAGNLIENAIRHSPRGGTVTVDVSSGPDVVRLAVRDEGPGIPPQVRERIFDRFVQGPEAGGSLGLGLYVAHELVDLHRGRILVEDVAPHGTAMIVELPRAGGVTPGSHHDDRLET